MIVGILGLALKHWRGAGLTLLLAAALAWGGWQHVRAGVAVGQRDKARASLASLRAVEKAANVRAAIEQRAADLEATREKASLAAQAASAEKALAEYRDEAKTAQAKLHEALSDIYARRPVARVWAATPVPASVLAAIRGGP